MLDDDAVVASRSHSRSHNSDNAITITLTTSNHVGVTCVGMSVAGLAFMISADK